MSRRAEAAGRDVAADGVFPLTEAEVATAIPGLWQSGQPTATLMAFRAEDWLASLPNPTARAWFAPLLPGQAPPNPSAANPPVADPPAADPTARWGTGRRAVTALRAELTAIVAMMTGLDPATIADDRPLRELGVDSLMTLKIRAEIARRTGLEVRITAFWAHPTTAAFARYLAGELAAQATPEPPAQETEPPALATEPPARDPEPAAPADKWEKYL
jgi:acyl carrier protein